MSLKKVLRAWLGIADDLNQSPPVENEEAKRLADEIARIRGQYLTFAADYENTLHVVMELQQKFDLLAETMGVVIVVNYTNGLPEPVIASISKDGLLGDAKEYINAVMVADKILGLNYTFMREQVKLLDTLMRKKK